MNRSPVMYLLAAGQGAAMVALALTAGYLAHHDDPAGALAAGAVAVIPAAGALFTVWLMARGAHRGLRVPADQAEAAVGLAAVVANWTPAHITRAAAAVRQVDLTEASRHAFAALVGTGRHTEHGPTYADLLPIADGGPAAVYLALVTADQLPAADFAALTGWWNAAGFLPVDVRATPTGAGRTHRR